VNTCVHYRKTRPAKTLPERDVGQWQVQADELCERRHVRKLVQQLPAHYRVVLILCYFCDLTYQEMAEVLGWSQGKVKNYLHRARGLFKKA